MASKYSRRWTSEQIVSAVDSLKSGVGESPFGITDEGFSDFRGLPIGDTLFLKGVVLDRIDFAGSRIDGKIIFNNSKISRGKFDGFTGSWGDLASDIRDVSFVKAKLLGSGFGGEGSVHERCDFSKANLSGSTGLKPNFASCIFDHTKFDNSMIRDCKFVDCKFVGKVKGVIFGGEFGVMKDCDLRQASFVDCTFNRFSFENCATSEETLIFSDWYSVLKLFAERLEHEPDPEVVLVGRVWISVWEERRQNSPTNLIDLADQVFLEGSRIGQELFRIYSQISVSFRSA